MPGSGGTSCARSGSQSQSMPSWRSSGGIAMTKPAMTATEAAASSATGPRAMLTSTSTTTPAPPRTRGRVPMPARSATRAPSALRHRLAQDGVERAVGGGGAGPVLLTERVLRPAGLAVEAGQGAQRALVDREAAQDVQAHLRGRAGAGERDAGLVQGGLEVCPRGDDP